MKYEFPPPAYGNDFQDLCKDLWSAEWRSIGAEHHGRNGSKQAGVDFYARLPQRGTWHGVQCKKKQRWPVRKLTIGEVEEELSKTKTFKPPLKRVTFATTAVRDTALQREVRLLNARLKHDRRGLTVEVAFWDDIVDLLNKHWDVAQQHYPHHTPIEPSWEKRVAHARFKNDYDVFYKNNNQVVKLLCRDADIVIYAQKGIFSLYFLRDHNRSTIGYTYVEPCTFDTEGLVGPLLEFFNDKPESFYYHFEEPARLNGSIKTGDAEHGFEHFAEDSLGFDGSGSNLRNRSSPPEVRLWVLRDNVQTFMSCFPSARIGFSGRRE